MMHTAALPLVPRVFPQVSFQPWHTVAVGDCSPPMLIEHLEVVGVSLEGDARYAILSERFIRSKPEEVTLYRERIQDLWSNPPSDITFSMLLDRIEELGYRTCPHEAAVLATIRGHQADNAAIRFMVEPLLAADNHTEGVFYLIINGQCTKVATPVRGRQCALDWSGRNRDRVWLPSSHVVFAAS